MPAGKKPFVSIPRNLEELARRVKVFLRKHDMTRAGDRVGVAVSGGADSVALLLLLLELRERLGVVLSVLHFNHQLRGRQSDADERFVAMLAEEHGLVFHADRANVAARAKKERRNLEDTARWLRYDFFTRLVKEDHVTRVAVAHTADDQAETVLGHILRGTGLAGLGGIHPISGLLASGIAGPIIRPLLEIRRAELRSYLKSRGQKWREDATNRDETRLRARIRRRLLPLLEKQFQPAVVPHLARLADLAREDEAFLDILAGERFAYLVERKEGALRIRVADLLEAWPKEVFTTEGTKKSKKGEAAKALAKRLVRRIVEEAKTHPGQLTAQHVDAVLELASRGQSGKSLALPGGVEVRRDLDTVIFCSGLAERSRSTRPAGSKARDKCESSGRYEFEVRLDAEGASVRVPAVGCVFRFRVIDWPPQARETKTDAVVLDRDRLKSPLVLRNWHPGDLYCPAGRQGAHKLKRLLLEKRVSRWEREGWPVLTSGGIVAWARGFPAADEFAPDARTRAGVVIVEERD